MINDKIIYCYSEQILTQPQARLTDALILKVNVYYDWYIAVSSLSIICNNNMCTFYIFVITYYLWYQLSTFIF